MLQTSASDWRILPEDRAKHDAKFYELKPINGFITGEQARELFLQSRLPQQVLGQIWTLADFNQDGKMDKLEFSIAMFLIKKKLQGIDLPSTLPPSLKHQSSMPMGSFNMSPMQGMGGIQGLGGMQQSMNLSSTSFSGMPSAGMHMSGSIMQPGASKSVPIMGSSMGASMQPGGVPPIVGSPDSRSRSGSVGADWAIPHPMKLKYKQMFNQNDRQRKGFLTGVEARAILQKSFLSNIALAEIWSLSDIDNDGKLTSEEFCLAMHLVDVAKSGQPLPKSLPPELIPPSYRRGLPPIGNAVGAPPLSPTIVKQGSIEADVVMDDKPKIFSLEEKKKMNFDRGQMELERRRAMLQEEQKKERDRQEYLEKQEYEKKERIRMEQERRRQMELEKQLARQREIEAEQEEQRRKIMEQREAARREMERQRQLELIKNKKHELESVRMREQEEIRHLKGKAKTLQCELGTLEDKKNELNRLLEERKNGVTGQHTSIILMSQSRDVKVSDIDRLQQDIQEIRKQKMITDQEKQKLQDSTKLIVKDSGISDTHKTVMHSLKNKKTTLEKLRENVTHVEADTATALQTIDASNKSLKELQTQLIKEQSELENLRRKYNIRIDAAKQIENTRKRDGEMAAKAERNREEEDRRNRAVLDMKMKEEQETQRKEEREKKQKDDKLEAIRKAQEMDKQKKEQSSTAAKIEAFANFDAFGKDPFADTGDVPPKSQNPNDPFASVFGGQSMFKTDSKNDAFAAFGASQSSTNTDKNADTFSNFSDFSSAKFDFGSQSNVKAGKPVAAARTSAVKSPTMSTSPKIATSDDKSTGEYSKYKALFPFGGENADDLEMKPGDIILVAKDQVAEPGWLGGEIDGQSGWFPENYAEKLPSGAASPEPMPNTTKPEPAKTIAQSLYDAFSSSNTVSNSFPPDSNFGDNTKFGNNSNFGSDSKVGADTNFSNDTTFVTDSSDGGWANFGQPIKESLYDTIQGAPKPIEKVMQAASESPVSSSPFKQVVPSETTTTEVATSNSDAVYAQAVFLWKAKTDNHLSFEKDDIITVTVQQEMWWYGQVNGQEGWFPKSNVKLIAAPNKTKSNAPEINVDIIDTEIGSAPEIEYVTLYTFSSEEPGDLHFEANETIYVTSTEGEWWTGRIGQQTGIFPSNYVQKVEGGKHKLTLSMPVDFSAKGGTLPKKEIARVIAAYQGTGPEQLTLGVGQMIQIRKKNSSGWWEGEQQIRGQKKQIGWFPANYVTLLTPGGSGKTTPLGAASPLTLDMRATTPAANMICQVIALYPYTSQKDDELTFQKNVVMNVMNQDDPDWWEGELNGSTGFFPSNYVQVLNDSTPSNHWCKDIYLLEAMSETEQKRQGRIHELFDTEKSYVDDMVLVVEVFKKPMEEQKQLTNHELGMLYVNWNELIQCNTKLHKAMLVRKTMSGKNQPVEQIGDILCEQLPHMTPYIRFCSCQLSASAMLQKKIDADPIFKDYLRAIARDKRTKGMPLSSFLIKPMQRITRYPMLIEKILKYTSEDHIDHENIKLALEKAEELCQQVNEGVRERENSDKLEWLQSHVDCTGLPEELVFNSLTNCLGPRKFLHSSMLHKVKSNKELYAFLFNDFLLLTQPVRPGLLFSFSDNKTEMMYKMYRQPLFLSEVSVKVASDAQDECVFHLTHIDKVYALKADSEKHKNKWIMQIESASKYSIETEKKKREKVQRARSMRSKGIGRLLVVIVEGADLKPSNSVTGHADPYCEVSMGGEENRTRFIPDTLNPKWNFNMQFIVRDLNQDVLCLTVYDKDFLSPDDFLGRTEVRIADIKKENYGKGPVTKRLLLHEVSTGEVVVKFDLILFEQT